jgi:maleate cis-trans isomerase
MDLPFKEMQNLPPADIRKFAGNVLSAAKDCDALYLPCPQWQASQIVDAFERETGTAAIAYSHANFFVAFKTLDIHDRIHGHGRLLASLAEMTR